MSNLVIVAIPARNEKIWEISSEKVPHLTLLFLGENTEDVSKLERIVEFVQHAVTSSEHGEFMLDVDERGTLGPDEADVVFFRKGYSLRWVSQFRNQLLQQDDIRTAYDSVDQYPEWQPHLTLGYPATPANEDEIPDHGLNWISFDRIAIWTDDYDGPEFKLEWPERFYDDGVMAMGSTDDARKQLGLEALKHSGVKGMRWGIRNRKGAPVAVAPKASSHIPHGAKRKTKVEVKGGENHPAHEDAIKVAESQAKLKKSGTAALSNHELRAVANRLQLENQVAVLTSSKGKAFVTKQLQNEGQNLTRAGVREGVKRGIAKAGAAAAVAA